MSVEVAQHVNGANPLQVAIDAWAIDCQDPKYLDEETFAGANLLEILIRYGEDLLSLLEAKVVSVEVGSAVQMASRTMPEPECFMSFNASICCVRLACLYWPLSTGQQTL